MATDLERLIVTIEANTKQFERAMRQLERTTDQAMSGVERSVKASAARQEGLFAGFGDSVGKKFQESFRKAVIGYFSIEFAREAINAFADTGNLAGIAFRDGLVTQLNNVKIEIGRILTEIALEFANKVGDMRANTARELGTILGAGASIVPEGIRIQGPNLPPDFRTGSQPSSIPYPEGVTEIEKLSDSIYKLADRIQAEPGVSSRTYVSPFNPKETYALPQDRFLPGYRKQSFLLPQPGELDAADAVIKSLMEQQDVLQRTNLEQEIYNNLHKAGANILPDETGAIVAMTKRLYEQKEALAQVKQLNDSLESSTKTFAQGLLDGQSAAESLNAALRQLASTLLDMALHSLFNPGGTPLLQTVFSGIGGSLGTGGSLGGRSGSFSPNTVINVQGSVDQKTLGAMKGMIERNNVRQNQELQRSWGNRQARYSALRGP
jgi:hypothetical protein